MKIGRPGPNLDLEPIESRVSLLRLSLYEVIEIIEICTRRFVQSIEMRTLLFEVPVDLLEALVYFDESLVYFDKSLVYADEALVYFDETRVYGGKPLVDFRIETIQTAVDRFQVIGCSHSAHHLIASSVHDEFRPQGPENARNRAHKSKNLPSA